MNDWLKELKVGDEVFVMRSGWGVSGYYAKVVRITKTLIVTQKGMAKEKWRITDGYPPGETYGRSYLVKPDGELKEQIEIQNLTRKAKNMKEDIKVPSEKADLERFIAALEPFVKKEGA